MPNKTAVGSEGGPYKDAIESTDTLVDGSGVAYLTVAPRWDDLRFPAQGIAIGVAVGDPDRQAETGLLLFDKDAIEAVGGIAQMPHSWQEGTELRPHVHVRSSTNPGGTGVVVWQLQYKFYNDTNDYLPAAYTTLTAVTLTLDDHVGGQPRASQILSLGSIDGAGKKASAILEWRLGRLATAGEDTYDADCVLLEFDIHYLKNAFGSEQEFPP